MIKIKAVHLIFHDCTCNTIYNNIINKVNIILYILNQMLRLLFSLKLMEMAKMRLLSI